jgi:hypothetical protein
MAAPATAATTPTAATTAVRAVNSHAATTNIAP